MIHKKILSLLVLLLTAVTGAWAQGTFSSDPYTSTTEFNSVSVKSSMTLNINEGVIVTVNSGLTIEDGVTLTLTGGGRLSVYGKSGAWGRDAFYEEGNRIVEATAGGDGNPAIILNDNAKIVIDNGEIYAEGGQGGFGGADATAGTNQPDGAAGNAFSRFPTIDGATLYYKSSNEWFKYTSGDQTLYNKMKAVPATIEVTTNKAEGETTFTEAWFNMPAYDATAEYELIRDMTVDMPVTIGDGKDGYRVRVEKADGKWKLADMTDAELMAKVKVRDSIEHKDLVFYGNDAVCGLKIYALSAEGKPTGDPITKATMAPGSFVIVSTAKEGSAYEGTSTSNTFELYVKSDLTLSASNYTIESGAATIKVDGTDKSAAIAEGKLAGIEMDAKVSLAANTAYMMSDVTVTSGDNKVTITTADGVSSFTMPDSAATMAYTIKRDITQKVTIQIADRVRLEKKDGKYDAVDPFELIPILTDKIGETDKNMFLGEATGTSGDFYIKGMQKLDGENWVDATELNIGTYRVVIAGMLNYDGTIYTDPIELYMGYEITVAAGEYASYYSAEALTTEDADAELYTIASVTDTEAVLSDKIKVAPKETPLLVYNKSEESKTFLLIPTDETADEVTVAKEFKGSLTEGEIPASSAVTDYYALNGKAFVWVKYAIEIGANKCWLQIGDQPAAARAMTRSIVGGGDTTGINAVDNEQLTDDSYFDLQGRKVAKPTRGGIYIHNGKKVILK